MGNHTITEPTVDKLRGRTPTEQYAAKLTTPATAVEYIQNGSTLCLALAAGMPQGLAKAVADRILAGRLAGALLFNCRCGHTDLLLHGVIRIPGRQEEVQTPRQGRQVRYIDEFQDLARFRRRRRMSICRMGIAIQHLRLEMSTGRHRDTTLEKVTLSHHER